MNPIRDEWRSDDGSVRLILGDCLQVLPTLSGIDAVVTDPPYGVKFQGKKNSHSQTRSGVGYVHDSDSDGIIGIACVTWCIAHIGRCVVTPGTRIAFKYPTPHDMGCVFIPNAAGYGRWGFTSSQPILYYGECPYNQRGMGARPNSFSSTEQAEDNGHPCPKPIGWSTWLVVRGSMYGETILDPFMGSGTTGVACVRTGRRFVGIEISTEYFAIAVKRCKDELERFPLFERPPELRQPELFP